MSDYTPKEPDTWGPEEDRVEPEVSMTVHQ